MDLKTICILEPSLVIGTAFQSVQLVYLKIIPIEWSKHCFSLGLCNIALVKK